jgi:hypothetical protein
LFENDKKLKKQRTSQYRLNIDRKVNTLDLSEMFSFNIANLDLQQLKLKLELYFGEKNSFYVTSLGKTFISDFNSQKWYQFR